MTEVTAARSSSKQNNDQNDGSDNVKTGNDGTTSGQENKEFPVATTSKTAKHDWTDKVKTEPYTTPSDEEEMYLEQIYREEEEYDGYLTDEIYRYSDTDFKEIGDSDSSIDNFSREWEENDSSNDEFDNPATVQSISDSKNKNNKCKIKVLSHEAKKREEKTDNIPRHVVSKDGGESSKTAKIDSDKNVRADPTAEEVCAGRSAENICSGPMAEDVCAGPSDEKDRAGHTAENVCTGPTAEEVRAGPSDEGIDKIKTAMNNKVKTKPTYTVPFKKSKNF